MAQDNVVECEVERDAGFCACGGGPTLSVLGDVGRAYQERMELIHSTGGPKKLQMQVDLLQSWVDALTAQNSLLVRTVEELEADITTNLLLERRKFSEMVCELRAETAVLRRRLARKDSDLRGLLEVLRRLRDLDYCSIDGIHFHDREGSKELCGAAEQLKRLNDKLHKDNLTKEKEIRKLKKELQEHEQTIRQLQAATSSSNVHTPEVQKMDAESTADLCCSTSQNCGDSRPEKDYTTVMREDAQLDQERLQEAEANLKSSCESVGALRAANAALRQEARALRARCAAHDRQLYVAALRSQFRDDIMHEMCQQLRQAKAKLKELEPIAKGSERSGRSASYDSLNISCVRPLVRRKRHSRDSHLDCRLDSHHECRPDSQLDSCRHHNPHDGSGDDNNI